MEREQTETIDFIKLLKCLNEKQQIGLNLTIEGLRLLAEKTKSGFRNR